jgi:arylsulfatase A-like enzyme
MDQGISALLEDLSSRGLLEETLVVWMGDMGRTPRHPEGYGRVRRALAPVAAVTGDEQGWRGQ